MDGAERRPRVFLPLCNRCKDGRRYQVSCRARDGTIYLRCHNTTFCKGSARFEDNDIISIRPHSQECLIDETSEMVGRFKKALKDALKNHWYKLRELYDQISLLYPEAAVSVSFQSVRGYMMRCRRIIYPARPLDLVEFSEQLEDPPDGRILEYVGGRFTTSLVVDSEEHNHLVIYDRDFVSTEIAPHVTKLFLDATFKSTPNLDDAYQLLTVMGIAFNHGIPIVWVVMSRKLQVSYAAVFQHIRDNVLPVSRIELIMSDFEAAIRNACNTVFPEAHCTGCNTHYDRAILQKLKSLGLQNFVRGDDDTKLFTKKMLALAYLPEDSIQDQYFRIKDALSDRLKRRLNGFFSYYERYWLRTVTPAGYSVFGLSRRTNNILESYNFKLGYQLQARPSPWNFIHKLLELQSHAKCDVERLKRRSGGITRHARYQTRYKNNQLQKAWKELYYGAITEDEFIIRAVHLKGNVTDRIANDADERAGEEFEMIETPRIIPLDNDIDYERNLFRDVGIAPFMRDIAARRRQRPNDRFPQPDDQPEPVNGENLVEPLDNVVVPNVLPRALPDHGNDEGLLLHVGALLRPAEDENVQELSEGDDLPEPAEAIALPEPVEDDALPEPVEDDALPEPVEDDALPDHVNDEAFPPNIEVLPEPIREYNGLPRLIDNEIPPLRVAAPPRPIHQQMLNENIARGRRAIRRRRQRQRRRNIDAQQAANPHGIRPPGEQRRNAQGESNERLCVTCQDNTITHAFLPCGHMICCEACSRRIYYDESLGFCPTCRVNVGRSPVRIYV